MQNPSTASRTTGFLEADTLACIFHSLGEDAVILHLLAGKRNGFFVDVGCHHPLRFSNTALLSEYFGWSGLNIDADADLISAFNEGRTRDINVCACIGKDRGVKHLNVFHETAVNTIDQAHADHMAAACFKLRERRPVEVFPLSDIVEAHVSADVDVDLLSVDAEGMDLEVLQSFDWKRRPQVVAVEAHGFTLSEAVAHPLTLLCRARATGLTRISW